jgi:PAS domain S-box-containing protein
VLGRGAPEVFPFLDERGETALLRQALDGRIAWSDTPRPFAEPVRRRGSYEAVRSPLRDRDGAIVGVTTLLRDVTDRCEWIERLREAESRFHSMADASPVLLWMSGPDSLRTFFNQTWLAFTGRTLEQEYGVGWVEGVHAEDAQRCMEAYRHAFEAREPFAIEYRLMRADGEDRVMLDRGVPRVTACGTFAGYVGSCVDITDHARVEARLKEAIRERESFLSIASHELRTPLTALELSLEKLLRNARREHPDDGNPFARDAARALAQAWRLEELVQELLDMTRLSGRLELELRNVDLGTLVAASIERLGDALGAAGCALSFERGAPVVGRWDPSRLERVAMNLLSNAIKYAHGKPVRVDVRSDGDWAILTVSDDGIGIPSEDQARIFDRFERAVSARNFGGLGLGLWIAREIVQMHGGSIQVTSVLGDGSTFTVSLPRGLARASAPTSG